MGPSTWKPRPPTTPYRTHAAQEPRRFGPLTLEEKRAVWVSLWGPRMRRAVQTGP